MKEKIYLCKLAGREIGFSFRHEDTVRFFGNWIRKAESSRDMALLQQRIVRIPYSDYEFWIREYGMGDDGYSEFGMSVYRSSDLLLKYGCCLFHGAAMLWHGKAWLFAGDSGVGKSTQLRHWLTLFPDETSVMNGDKPVLCLEKNGNIVVYPSPWKGKERLGDDSLKAPLGGIIILKQAGLNMIHRVSPVYCTAKLLSLFFCTFRDRDTVKRLCRFEEAMLESVPVWELSNCGDTESAMLTYNTLIAEAQYDL